MKTAFGNIRGGFTALLFSSLLAACEGGVGHQRQQRRQQLTLHL